MVCTSSIIELKYPQCFCFYFRPPKKYKIIPQLPRNRPSPVIGLVNLPRRPQLQRHQANRGQVRQPQLFRQGSRFRQGGGGEGDIGNLHLADDEELDLAPVRHQSGGGRYQNSYEDFGSFKNDRTK
jgi:hypothetical protein